MAGNDSEEKDLARMDSESLDVSRKRLDLTERQFALEQNKLEFERAKHREEMDFRKAQADLTWKQQSETASRNRVRSVIMPLILVALTGFIGTILGVYLQNRSFRRNELFKARLDQVVRQRGDAVRLLEDVEQAWRQVRANLESAQSVSLSDAPMGAEYCRLLPRSAGMQTLREAHGTNVAILETANLADYADVTTAVKKFDRGLQRFLECAESCKLCSEGQTDLQEPLKELIRAYNLVENRMLAGAE